MSEQPEQPDGTEPAVDPQAVEAMQAIFASMTPDNDMLIEAGAANHLKWYLAWQRHGAPEYRAAEWTMTMIAEQARQRLSWLRRSRRVLPA